MVKKTLNNAGGYSTNNTVSLIRGGAPYFKLLEQLIDQAKESIHLQMYIYEDDETGNRISDALMRSAKKGVQVYLLLDGYASRSLSSDSVKSMEEAGIHFRWFQPLFRGDKFFVGRRMHHKIFVGDGWNGLVGGLNITNRYNDMPDEPAWLDWAVHVTGEVSLELYNRCIQMWFRRPPTPSAQPKTSSPDLGNCAVRVRINDWVRNRNQISRSYLDMLTKSQESITIMTSYFMPGRVFRKNLRLASIRGIKIRVILTKISDVPIAKQAERFFYPWMLRRNIEIYEYRQKVLHGKMASCDSQWVTVGSYNFNDLSAYVSIELNLDIHDQNFAQQVEAALDKIILEDCDRITEESMTRSTRWWNLAAYRIAYSVGRLFLLVFTFRLTRHRSAGK